jgi:hypothetical protein
MTPSERAHFLALAAERARLDGDTTASLALAFAAAEALKQKDDKDA